MRPFEAASENDGAEPVDVFAYVNDGGFLSGIDVTWGLSDHAPITLRTYRLPTAWHLAVDAIVHIMCVSSQAPHRRSRLSSKVRPHKQMLDDFLRERQIRRAIRAIARQRVAIVLQPGNVQVLERSPPRDEWFELGVQTAMIRGWVEVLHENMPTGQVRFQGSSPSFPEQMAPATHYKLTEGGWAVLNRSQAWILATFIVSAFGLLVSVAALVVAWLSMPKS